MTDNNCDTDYLAVDLEALVDNCECFLYDVHDPTSCRMGSVLLMSSYGGGQDQWLLMTAAMALLLWANLVTTRGDQASLANELRSSRLGRVAALAALLMLVVHVIGRFFFALANRRLSRNANVGLSAFFYVGAFVVNLAVVAAWWRSRAAIAAEDAAEDAETPVTVGTARAPGAGIFRKTVLLFVANETLRANGGAVRAARMAALAAEAFFAVCAVVYVICAVVLSVANAQDEDKLPLFRAFFFGLNFFNVGVILFCIDNLLAVTVHFYNGLRGRAGPGDDPQGSPGSSGSSRAEGGRTGMEQRPLQRRETALVATLSLLLLMQASLSLRLSVGYCPYISYTEDLYHGGDPAEYASSDIANFLVLFFISLHLLQAHYRAASLYWRRPDANAHASARRAQPGDHPDKARLDAVASVVTSVVVFVCALAIVIMDSQYKIDAGMVGRIAYFVGFLVALLVLSDRRLAFAALDGRSREPAAVVARVVAVAVLAALLLVYLVVLVFWLKEPESLSAGNTDEYPKFQSFVIFGSVVCQAAKVPTLWVYDAYAAAAGAAASAGAAGDDADAGDDAGTAAGVDAGTAAGVDAGTAAGVDAGACAGADEAGVRSAVAEVDVEMEMEMEMDGDDAEAGGEHFAVKDVEEVVLREEGKEEKVRLAAASNDNSNSSGSSPGVVAVGKRLRVLDDLAALLVAGFELWLLVALVWNALSLLLVLWLGSQAASMHLKRRWMQADLRLPAEQQQRQQRQQLQRKLGRGRSAQMGLAQLVAGAVLYFAFVLPYLAGEPLPHYAGQVLVTGHRAVWADGVAENSRAAMDLAVSAAYHGVEVDMRMTSDQQLVVMHDLSLERTTMDGTGAVAEMTLAEVTQLTLKKRGGGASDEQPMTMDEVLAAAKARSLLLNVEVKQDKNLSSIALALDAICRAQHQTMSFISTGDTRFQHLLYYLEPRVTLEKDFLLHTPAMASSTPANVNVYAISAELLLFNMWVVPNSHAAGMAVMVYFLATETPALINFFLALGVDIVLLNDPQHCLDADVCMPAKNFTLPRFIPPV